MSQAGILNTSGGGPSTDLHVARYIVSAGGITDGANYTTIATAYAAAVSAGAPQTVFIQPGTYTENITLTAGINLAAFQADALTPNVTINGMLTATFAGTVSISGICLQTNSNFALSVTGSAATLVELQGCFVYALNNNAIHFTSSSGASKIELRNCKGDFGNTGIGFLTFSGVGALKIFGGAYENNAASSTVSTVSGGGTLNINNAFIFFPITTSGTSNVAIINCEVFSPLIINGNGAQILCSYISGGADSAITVSGSAALDLYECTIDSSNTNAITGSGTIRYGGISFSSFSSTINTTTQIPKSFSVPQGGTGDSSFIAYAPVIGGITTVDALQSADTGISNSGYVFTSTGAASPPTWQASGGGGISEYFSAYLSAPTAAVTGDGTIYGPIVFDTALSNTGNYNAGTGVYTAPATGQYSFQHSIVFNGGDPAVTQYITFWNGSVYGTRSFQLQPLAGGGTFVFSASIFISMTIGDTMSVTAFASGGVSKTVTIYGATPGGGAITSAFSGFKVA